MHETDGLDFWEAKGISYFRELSSFGALPDEIILYLLREGKLISLDVGDTLYSRGDRSDAFYIVLEGASETFMAGKKDRWSFVRCHEAGEDMGFAAMIALRDRAAMTVAKSQSVVLEVSSDLFFQLHGKDPDAFGLMMLNLTRGMARAIINMAYALAKKDVRLVDTV
ncbi:hypothetical protein A8B84_04955 [Marinobacter sp. EhC06]|jgi:CRP-like cAMP-binding protein|uniref:cyclic nucleotide-binding domain-containing protein n=1 Tax=Marinobacter TaxID=2742 RepID=UPI0007D8EBFB|nr:MULTISPECIES: Crp/Fnr family transcriptional regulator [unclassified Marinobacter]OAN87990.1 hypothetical protein A8B80_03165 [Marinobacter sp. EhN04]OAN90974.1 hypothetical protein A8B84_04955 [Marinobacter sp. EhC06]